MEISLYNKQGMANEYIIRTKKFKTKKRLGQNFLVSKEIIDEILKNVSSEDNILEIGAGAGFVTEKLVLKAKKVIAVEIDENACNLLLNNLARYKNFTLIHNDILKTDISELFEKGQRIKIVANIPYYITTPILVHLLGEIDEINHKTRSAINEIILMVQYEVAKRIVADENSKNKEYGLLSILSNFWAETEIIKKVSKKCFYPSPKVDSALVKFKIKSEPKVPITPYLKQVIKAAFSMRRKNIKNCLLACGFVNVPDALQQCGFNSNLRGENLSVEDFYKLSLKLKRNEDEIKS